MKRFRLEILVPTIVVAAFCLGPGLASADVTTPPGRCTGTAAFAEGVNGPFTLDSARLQPNDVTTIPLADQVVWAGSLVGVTEATQRDISGYVKVDMPWPVPDITIDEWNGPSSRTSNEGTEDYSLPSFIPRGTVIEVYGEHRENGALFCSGTLKVKVAGSAFSSPLTALSAVLLVGSLGLSMLASRRSSPGFGAGAGLATMLSLGLALLSLGVLPLNSPLLTVLPVAGIALGAIWGKLALFAA